MERRQARMMVFRLEAADVRTSIIANIEEDGKGASIVADQPLRGAPGAAWWFARVAIILTWRGLVACRGFAFAQCAGQEKVSLYAICAAFRSVVTTWITTVLRLKNRVVSQDWLLFAVSWSEAFQNTCQLERLVRGSLCAWTHRVIGISEKRCGRAWSPLMKKHCGQDSCGARRS